MTTTERLRAATVATAANNGNESPELGEYGCFVGGRARLEGTHQEILDKPPD